MIGTIVLASAIVVAASIAAVAYVVAAKRRALPSRELAAAVRTLDRILAYDDAVPSLSTELRDEARRITRHYHKEIS